MSKKLFRLQFTTTIEGVRDTDRLIVVVAITTFLSVIVSVPRILEYILGNMFMTNDAFLINLTFADKIFRIISVPTTFILFGSLSPTFRETCKKMCVCMSDRT